MPRLKARYQQRTKEPKQNRRRLDAQLHKLTPVTWESHWRENVEVILVAIVVAVGIRSYFLQPFKIPTGSMQPHPQWNYRAPRTEPAPNIFNKWRSSSFLAAITSMLFRRKTIALSSPAEEVRLLLYSSRDHLPPTEFHSSMLPRICCGENFRVLTGRGNKTRRDSRTRRDRHR